ncbi:MAG: damage-inducible protein DinB, partial [Mesorhizobium sp.]
HDIHHRGQVHAMLSGTSVSPPQLDEFLLDYDLKLRQAEVERLGIADQASVTSYAEK